MYILIYLLYTYITIGHHIYSGCHVSEWSSWSRNVHEGLTVATYRYETRNELTSHHHKCMNNIDLCIDNLYLRHNQISTFLIAPLTPLECCLLQLTGDQCYGCWPCSHGAK